MVYLAAIKIFIALDDPSISESRQGRTFSRLGRSIRLLLSSSPQTPRESAGYHIIHAASWPIPIHYSLSRRVIKEMHYLYQDCWPFLLRDSFYRVLLFAWPISDDTYQALCQFRSSAIQHTRFMLPLFV